MLTKSFSKLTIALAAYIIISASFMLQFRNFLVKTFGEKTIIISFFFVSALLGLSYLIHIYRKIHIIGVLFSVFIFVLAYFLMSEQPFFAEKIHVLEYGILGYLGLRDLLKKGNKIFIKILQAILFVAVIGSLDEGFQYILPYRVGEIRDVMTNIASGGLGILQYLVFCKVSLQINPPSS